MSDLNRVVDASSRTDSPFPTFAEDLPTPGRDELTPRIREGLPPAYRMRADSHYVDQLDSPPAMTIQFVAVQSIEFVDESSSAAIPALVDSIKRHGVLEPLLVQKHDRRHRLISGKKRLVAAITAGLREVPCVIHRVDDEQARLLTAAAKAPSAAAVSARDAKATALPATDAELANSLSSLASCAALLADSTPRLARAMAADLIRAEVWRAACLLHAARVLRHGVPPSSRLVSPGDLVQAVVRALGIDAKLRGFTVEGMVTVAEDASIRGDRELLVYGLSGLVLTMFSAMEGTGAGRVTITALPETVGRVTVSVSQESVAVPESWPASLIESALDGGGASSTAISILALRRLAEAGDGRLAMTRLPNGCRVSIDLPLDGANGAKITKGTT